MLKVIGYGDRFSVRPGETIRFMVSCEGHEAYRADIVRIIHGDINPDGPGYKEEPIETAAGGTYAGRRQPVHAGSSVLIPDHRVLCALESFHVQVMVWPTTPQAGEQGLITKWSDRGGFALIIDGSGELALKLADGKGGTDMFSSGKTLHERQWYRLAASYDRESGDVVLIQEPLARYPVADMATRVEGKSAVVARLDNGAPLVMGAWFEARDDERVVTGGHFNGKLEGPRLARRRFSESEMEALAAPMPATPLASGRASGIAAFVADVIGAWDFAQDMTTTRVSDLSANRLHGRILNLPARAMKGHNWDGTEMNWRQAPEQYGAIHFHADDVYDLQWEEDFAFTVPEGFRSGFYAARVSAGEDEEYIPFFVIPPRSKATAKLAFLVPTASYMAYANEHMVLILDPGAGALGRLTVLTPADMFLNEHREFGYSLYDYHADGSGVCYSSRLRPVVNMRPKHQCWGGLMGSNLHQYNADTHIIDWLEATGHDYDVITDEDLHAEGLELLAPYRAVMTGTHPEYHSVQMLDALQAFTDRGGRLIYLGANGFYWRIAFHEELPGVIEVRRAEGGIRTWIAEPGEYYHSFTGEYGGLWLRQGRAPQTIAGVGFTSQGFDISAPYTRLPDSFDPRAAFIFEGIGDDELIGDFGLIGGAAAGCEIDRADAQRGTPPHALVLATSMGGHTDTYLAVIEDLHATAVNITGTTSPLVRADIMFYETPNGGAVFATGSIAWAGSFSHNGYKNNVSRIIDNVVRRFVDETPF